MTSMTSALGAARIPLSGDIINIILSQVTMAAVTFCLTRRIQSIRSWRSLPPSLWLVILIYCDSFLFVLFTAIVSKGLGINTSKAVCEGGIILCLVCYVTTKVMTYLFLVEKAYLVRGTRMSRLKEPQYRWNFCGIVGAFSIIIVLNFVFRIAYIDDTGECIIGMKKTSMIPLITFEIMVNVYLTTLFIIPLRKLYSYKRTSNSALSRMVFRSFIGSCTTLTSSVSNLTVLMVLNGEPGWVCLMLCNADVLFSVLILHWVTSFDTLRNGSRRTAAVEGAARNRSSDNPGNGDPAPNRMVLWHTSRRTGTEPNPDQDVDIESILGTRSRIPAPGRPHVTTEIHGGNHKSDGTSKLSPGGGTGNFELDTIDIQVRTEQRRDHIVPDMLDDARGPKRSRPRIKRTTTIVGLSSPPEDDDPDSKNGDRALDTIELGDGDTSDPDGRWSQSDDSAKQEVVAPVHTVLWSPHSRMASPTLGRVSQPDEADQAEHPAPSIRPPSPAQVNRGGAS